MRLMARAARMARTDRGEARGYWATAVAAAGSPHVVLDVDPSGTPREVSANAVGTLMLGSRVRVELRGRRLTIVGKP